jgi:SAM-dependent methyltransferase
MLPMPPVLSRLSGLVRRLLPPAGVRHAGVLLPPREVRWCGPRFRDDAFFLASARAEAERVCGRMGCGAGTRVLEVGCGYGRLAIGLRERLPALDYLGVDVHAGSIAWCARRLTPGTPGYRFVRLGVENARYNPGGASFDERFRLPLGDGAADLVYLYSVASHLTERHLTLYLRELARVLAPRGRVFLTAFVEGGVPPVSENPAGYAVPRCNGPLHVVRYQRGHFLVLAESAGLRCEALEHGGETDGQSALYLRHAGA